MSTLPTFQSYIASPVGPLHATATAGALLSLRFCVEADSSLLASSQSNSSHPLLDELTLQLSQYFAGSRTTFSIPLAPSGTAFQSAVWLHLQNIPYGQTRSYGQLATTLGKPSASRAVGLANGANPIPILIPCHRVIAANGTLCGFGGGLWRKQFLLKLEGFSPPVNTKAQDSQPSLFAAHA